MKTKILLLISLFINTLLLIILLAFVINSRLNKDESNVENEITNEEGEYNNLDVNTAEDGEEEVLQDADLTTSYTFEYGCSGKNITIDYLKGATVETTELTGEIAVVLPGCKTTEITYGDVSIKINPVYEAYGYEYSEVEFVGANTQFGEIYRVINPGSPTDDFLKNYSNQKDGNLLAPAIFNNVEGDGKILFSISTNASGSDLVAVDEMILSLSAE